MCFSVSMMMKTTPTPKKGSMLSKVRGGVPFPFTIFCAKSVENVEYQKRGLCAGIDEAVNGMGGWRLTNVFFCPLRCISRSSLGVRWRLTNVNFPSKGVFSLLPFLNV